MIEMPQANADLDTTTAWVNQVLTERRRRDRERRNRMMLVLPPILDSLASTLRTMGSEWDTVIVSPSFWMFLEDLDRVLMRTSFE